MSQNGRYGLILALLGMTQIIGYGTLYYSFGLLSADMARDFGWSQDWNFGLLSVAFVVNGLVSPFAGRLMDRFGAGLPMSIGSALAAGSLVLCALASQGMTFGIALVASQIAAAFVQYAAAFTCLVQLNPLRASAHITILTLMAGFASTLFWPLTSWLLHSLTWREIYLIYGLMHVLVCLPAHFWLSRFTHADPIRSADEPALPSQNQIIGLLSAGQRQAGFALLAGALAMLSLVNSAILVHMVPLLEAIGLGAFSIGVSAVFGPAQFLIRLSNFVFGREISALWLAIAAAGFEMAGPLILLLFAPHLWGGVAFAVIFGMGSGLGSIIQGTVPLLLFGSDGYGASIGKLTAIRLGVGAGAPLLLSSVLHSQGVRVALLMVVVMGAISLAAFILLKALVKKPL